MNKSLLHIPAILSSGPPSPEFSEELAAIQRDFSSLSARIDNYSGRVQAVELEGLRAEHESLRVTCRTLLENAEQAEADADTAKNALWNLQGKRNAALAALRAVQAKTPQPHRFPSADEIKKWRAAHDAATADADHLYDCQVVAV